MARLVSQMICRSCRVVALCLAGRVSKVGQRATPHLRQKLICYAFVLAPCTDRYYCRCVDVSGMCPRGGKEGE